MTYISAEKAKNLTDLKKHVFCDILYPMFVHYIYGFTKRGIILKNKRFAKFISVALILVLVLSLAACGGNSAQSGNQTGNTSGNSKNQEAGGETKPSETKQDTASATPLPTEEPVEMPEEYADSSASESFRKMCDELFTLLITTDSITYHYRVLNPEAYNLSEIEPTIGDYSAEQAHKDHELIEKIYRGFRAVDYDALKRSEQEDYDAILEFLKDFLDTGDNPYLSERLSPTTGLQAQLPLLLAQYTFYSADDIDIYLEVLKSVKTSFDGICRFEREKSEAGYFMTDEVADSILEQCRKFVENPEENLLIETFEYTVDALDYLSAEQKEDYKAMNRQAVLEYVIPSYENIIATLTELKGTGVNKGGLCGFDGGKEYYEALVRYETGTSKTINEVKSMLNSELASCLLSITKISGADNSIPMAAEHIVFPETEPVKIIDNLKEAMADDFPEPEDVNYSIDYVPDALKPFLSPAMYLTPPIDDNNSNRIFINDNGTYDMSQLYSVMAHEGYPGHLYQFIYYNGTNPSPVRNLIQCTGYSEGWAQYCEVMSYSLAGLDSNLAEYMKATTIAVLCLYSLSDIGIHYEGWDLERTKKFWRDYGVSEENAEEIYYTNLAEPGVYLPYSVGYLELMELRNYMNDKLGDRFELSDFHTFYLENGNARHDVLAKALDRWIEEH